MLENFSLKYHGKKAHLSHVQDLVRVVEYLNCLGVGVVPTVVGGGGG